MEIVLKTGALILVTIGQFLLYLLRDQIKGAIWRAA